MDGTGDSLKNVVVFGSADGSLQLEATTISLILHPALFLVLVPVLYMRFLGMKIEEKPCLSPFLHPVGCVHAVQSSVNTSLATTQSSNLSV